MISNLIFLMSGLMLGFCLGLIWALRSVDQLIERELMNSGMFTVPKKLSKEDIQFEKAYDWIKKRNRRWKL